LRGHANIQARPIFHALRFAARLLADALDAARRTDVRAVSEERDQAGLVVERAKYITSLLKAYYGDAATPENDFCFEYLPQISGDYSVLPTRSR